MIITEENLKKWSKPASDSEEQTCNITLQKITHCINKYNFAHLGTPIVKTRGSFENNTNVRRSSDVDMYVLFNNFFYQCDYNLLRVPATGIVGPSFNVFKQEVINALKNDFGDNAIIIGNKSIKINSYVKADVVPVLLLKQYDKDIGVSFFTNRGDFIINFPQQDADNGIHKNELTHHHYKWFVRIFKTMRNILLEERLINNIPSYVIESLLYNVPNYLFNQNSYIEELAFILKWLLNNVTYASFYETNEIKPMFVPNKFSEQNTTRMDVFVFLNTINQLLVARKVA